MSILSYIDAAQEVLRVQGPRRLAERMYDVCFPENLHRGVMRALLQLAHPDATLIDVGACDGTVSLAVARHYKRCLCLEPSPSNFARLKAAIRSSGATNIEARAFAAGDQTRVAGFFLSPDLRGDNRFCISAEERFSSIEVEVRTLDELVREFGIDGPCVLKVDVQGAEFAVMRGAQDLLLKGCPVVTEFWPWGMRTHGHAAEDYVSYMRELGYRFSRLSGGGVHSRYLRRMCLLGFDKKRVHDDFVLTQRGALRDRRSLRFVKPRTRT